MHRATCTVCDHHDTDPGQLLCPLCLDDLAANLRELAAGYPRLDPAPGSTPLQAGGRAPGYESASPARDDVLVLTDRRRVAFAPDSAETRAPTSLYGQVRAWHEDAAAAGLVDRPRRLFEVAARGCATPAGRSVPAQLADLIGVRWDLAAQWWAPDMHWQAERAVHQLRRALGEEVRLVALGECPRPAPDLPVAEDLHEAAVDQWGPILAASATNEDGTPLYPHCGGRVRSRGWGHAARCERCRWRWRTVDELRRLGAQLGGAMLDLPGLARYLDMPDRQATLRSWAMRDRWHRERVGRRTLYSLDDARASWWAAWERAHPVHGPELPPPAVAAEVPVPLQLVRLVEHEAEVGPVELGLLAA